MTASAFSRIGTYRTFSDAIASAAAIVAASIARCSDRSSRALAPASRATPSVRPNQYAPVVVAAHARTATSNAQSGTGTTSGTPADRQTVAAPIAPDGPQDAKGGVAPRDCHPVRRDVANLRTNRDAPLELSRPVRGMNQAGGPCNPALSFRNVHLARIHVEIRSDEHDDAAERLRVPRAKFVLPSRYARPTLGVVSPRLFGRDAKRLPVDRQFPEHAVGTVAVLSAANQDEVHGATGNGSDGSPVSAVTIARSAVR